MNFTEAADDFLMYLEVEKNYSHNTLRSYAFDLFSIRFVPHSGQNFK
ncbi:site-specific integrase [Bacillus sp. EB600]|nr:site-specific integrase [Bacillus sp. EB600]MCQ6282168.1 site-specific integrase [Bacillus sp. EB600]